MDEAAYRAALTRLTTLILEDEASPEIAALGDAVSQYEKDILGQVIPPLHAKVTFRMEQSGLNPNVLFKVFDSPSSVWKFLGGRYSPSPEERERLRQRVGV